MQALGNCTLRSLVALTLLVASCGGDDGPGDDADAGRFEITERSPLPGGALFTGGAVIVTLSAAADPASIGDASVTLEAGGDVAVTRALSADGRTLTLELDEVPPLPATITVAIGSGLRSAEGVALEPVEWSLELPLWHARYVGGADMARPAAVALADGTIVVASVEGGAVATRRVEGDATADLAHDESAAAVALAAGDGGAVLAFADPARGVRVDRLAQNGWETVGDGFVAGSTGATEIAVALDGDAPVVAWRSDAAVQVARHDGDAWQALGEPLPARPGHLGLAATPGGVALVYDTADATVVARFDGAAWQPLGAPLAGPLGAAASLVTDEAGAPIVAWRSRDVATVEHTAQVARWGGAAWQPLGALDLEADDAIDDPPALATGPEGALWAAWIETSQHGDRLYVAAREDDAWRVHGGAIASAARLPALVVDGDAAPMVAAIDGGELALARWNRSPVLPAVFDGAAGDDGCTVPSSPAPRLSDTGCYADTAAHELAPAAVPYSVRAPLWSDAAPKRRAVIVPAGERIGFAQVGPWSFPVGAILIKEFWVETRVGDPGSRVPVETRFWVKRCEDGDCLEPWQGYSYQWNEAGTDADLVAGNSAVRVDWPVTTEDGDAAVHSHIIPSRFECIRCHNQAAGRTLGLRAGQLAGAHDYGEIVEQPLRAFAQRGLFDESAAIDEVTPWPSPRDTGAPLALRSRAYLAANCSFCHKLDLSGDELIGEAPTMDLRFTTSLADSKLCTSVVPGDADASLLHQRMASRADDQMPPLATDVVDTATLAVVAAWIDSLVTCP